MSNVIAAGHTLLHVERTGTPGAAPVVVLDNAIYAHRTAEGAGPSSQPLAAALAAMHPVHVLTQIEPADGSPRTLDASTWANDAAALASWLASDLAAATTAATAAADPAHLIGVGNAALLASLTAMERPELVASLTLLDPLVYLPGADALLDPALDPGTLACTDPLAWIAASRLMHSRKAILATLVPCLRAEGLPRPVHLLFGHATASRAGMALVDLFDLFAARQCHTDLHVAGEAGETASLARDWLAAFHPSSGPRP